MAEMTLSKEQQDTLGEIANISMGSSATSLSALLNNLKVDITTPKIDLIRKSEALDDYNNVCVLVHINYVKGLSGSNVLILKENDVKIIADLMMGGDGSNTAGEVGELQLSAVSEAILVPQLHPHAGLPGERLLQLPPAFPAGVRPSPGLRALPGGAYALRRGLPPPDQIPPGEFFLRDPASPPQRRAEKQDSRHTPQVHRLP